MASSWPTSPASEAEQGASPCLLRFETEPDAETELGVVLEQRVAPSRPAPFGVGRPRRRRQVAAVDRRAAGGIGHEHAVPEQLAGQLQVGRLAAAVTGSGELEQGLESLGALHRVVRQEGAVQLRDGQEEVPVVPQPVPVNERRFHVDGLVLGLGLGLRRAHVDADTAAGAVVNGHLRWPCGDRGGPWNGRAWTRSPREPRRALREGRPSCG